MPKSDQQQPQLSNTNLLCVMALLLSLQVFSTSVEVNLSEASVSLTTKSLTTVTCRPLDFFLWEPSCIIEQQQQQEVELKNKKSKQYSMLAEEVNSGLEVKAPQLTQEGAGGAYFMFNKDGNKAAVFKPQDQEPFAANNPKQVTEQKASPLEQAIPLGGGAKREVAAYLLDNNWAGVPETTFYNCSHSVLGPDEKHGSLQKFMKSDCPSWDMGSSNFSEADIHRIGLLDLMTMNLDRHGGNLLVNKETTPHKIIPIDHGLSLPSVEVLTKLQSLYTWFEWLNFQQSKKEFSEETKEHIKSISLAENITTLRSLGFAEPEILTHVLGTLFVKRSMDNGFNLHQMGTFVCGRQQQFSKCVTEFLLQYPLDSSFEVKADDVANIFIPILDSHF